MFQHFLYEPLLRWCLAHKLLFLSLPAMILLSRWLLVAGFRSHLLVHSQATLIVVGVSESTIRESRPGWRPRTAFPGIGKEFMPPLDEGFVSLHADHDATRFDR